MVGSVNYWLKRRISAPPSSVKRQEAVCLHIPAALEDNQAYHRKCYSRYNNHLDKSPPVSTTLTSTQPTPSTSTIKSGDKIIFNPQCIFCNVAELIRFRKKGVPENIPLWLRWCPGCNWYCSSASGWEAPVSYLRSGLIFLQDPLSQFMLQEIYNWTKIDEHWSRKHIQKAGTGKISQSWTDSCVCFKWPMLQLRLSHHDKNWLLQLQSTLSYMRHYQTCIFRGRVCYNCGPGWESPREQSCIWIMYTNASDMVNMSLHMQPWHPAGACVCRLYLSHRTSTTETDHHRFLPHDQWDNKRLQSCEGTPSKVPESHRRSRSSIHNHNIDLGVIMKAMPNNFGEARHSSLKSLQLDCLFNSLLC